MKLYTIGFAGKSAERFFELLRGSGARRIIDVRLHNVSPLAGFAKKRDLEYFAKTICGIECLHLLDLAPTPALLDQYKKREIDWPEYERQFIGLLERRRIHDTVAPDLVADSCLLCSEAEPHQCHRRLVAEYLAQRWMDVQIVHLQ